MGLEWRGMTRTRDMRLGLGSGVRDIHLAVLTVVTLFDSTLLCEILPVYVNTGIVTVL